MLEIVTAGGWLMLPIIACSVIAMAIVVERCWSLQTRRILPAETLGQARKCLLRHRIPADQLQRLASGSPLGRVLAAGLSTRHLARGQIKSAMEETGAHVAHEMQRYLNALGTIATITPLLGLLGTVIGMISVFTRITSAGVGDPTALAGGISQALITTAAGLGIGIPSLMMYRYFRNRIETLVVSMEQHSLKLLEAIDSPLNDRAKRQGSDKNRSGEGVHDSAYATVEFEPVP